VAFSLPPGEVLDSLEDRDVSDQVVGGELVVDPGVLVLAEIVDEVEPDARELLRERLGDEVPLAGLVAAHVDGQFPALGEGLPVERLQLG
jgi:hypothetical protein